MIRSFKNQETEAIYKGIITKKLPIDIQKIARRKMDYINAAYNINDLRNPPGNRLEKIKGERMGQYSIRINDQWRICFDWKDNMAYKVEITDYHAE